MLPVALTTKMPGADHINDNFLFCVALQEFLGGCFQYNVDNIEVINEF